MRLCVLGGTRFVGLAVVEHLARRGHDLLLIHRGRSEPDALRSVEHLHVERERLAVEASQLDAFAPEAVVDTYAMTADQADAALAVLASGVPLVVLSSMDVYPPTPLC
jgi:NAD(P)-dependent dehydrogenase (short-subunit alcohol dehydrogenase family)